jgi:PAS domain-containing protein
MDPLRAFGNRLKMDPPFFDAVDVIRAVLLDTSDTFALIDDDGVFLALFAGAAYVGRPPSDLIGKKIRDLIPAPIAERIMAAIAAARLGGPVVTVEHPRPSADGMREVCARIVRCGADRVYAHVVDITQEKAAGRAASESHARYVHLAQATTDAAFDWDVARDEVVWHGQLAQAFSYDSSQKTTFSWWVDKIHPDEAAAVVESATRTMDDATQSVWTGEYRFRHADGRYRDVFGRASLLRDEQGRCVRVVGSILDVVADDEHDVLRVRSNVRAHHPSPSQN